MYFNYFLAYIDFIESLYINAYIDLADQISNIYINKG